MSTRWVVVDDTDPGIQYTGSWFQDQGSTDAWGNLGPTFNTTQHGTMSNAGFSYTFSGFQVLIKGSSNLRNDSGVIDPSWECFIDDVSIGAIVASSVRENNDILCSKTASLPDGPHVFTVRTTVRNGQTFWFDTLQYAPSPTLAPDEKVVLVVSQDHQLKYSSGWTAFETKKLTSQGGATLTFDFIGVSLLWIGVFPGSDFPTGPSTATYSIDGQTPINFVVNGSTETMYHQNFFQTGKLSPGSHKLSVVYTSATNQSTPLCLQNLVIQNGTVSSSGSSGPKPGSGTNTHVTVRHTLHIIDGVVGGLGGLGVICLIIYLLRRWKRHKEFKQAKPDVPAEPPFLGRQFSLSSDFSRGSMASYDQTKSGPQFIAEPSSSSGHIFPINTHSSNIATQPSLSAPCLLGTVDNL